MSVHLFGIRHHGVGSARSLLAALERLQPDCILIEGPPDADALIPLVAHEAMQPPIALLVYDPDRPQQAAWYPLAVFSPEWQAMRYGLASGATVRFMDLPQKHQQHDHDAALQDMPADTQIPDTENESVETDALPFDPLGALAAAAGEDDGERWWGRVIEEIRNPAEIFELIHDAMTALRSEQPMKSAAEQRTEALREAWMRTTIRNAEAHYERVAVVCGAWHTPALIERASSRTADKALLSGLPKRKTVATFAPWTYSRLTYTSGYGAGIDSPGWYHHLWETAEGEIPARWLARAATLLRSEGLQASTAQVIDGVRLAEMLALMRGRAVGLDELNEATVAILCAGRVEPLRLIRSQLIISDRMGSVPPETPAVPLQRDLAAQQKRLRLQVSADQRELDLDLRQPTDLTRSQLFHRLNLLNIPWATQAQAAVRGKGTFHEFWTLVWTPELEIRLIEASVWGNTIESAAQAYAQEIAAKAIHLAALTSLLRQIMVSALPAAVDVAVRSLNNLASLTHDIGELMDAAPPLVETMRYGDVRKTDADLIEPVLKSIVVRICTGLYGASLHLDDDAAGKLYTRMMMFNSALQISDVKALLDRWQGALAALTGSSSTHPLLAGAAVRLLFQAKQMNSEQMAVAMRRAFSVGHDAHYGVNWLEGFLTDMEHVLLLDDTLFLLVDDWVSSLPDDQFTNMLPLLRRTFATFNAPARRSLSERIVKGVRIIKPDALDEVRAARVMPVLRQILGVQS